MSLAAWSPNSLHILYPQLSYSPYVQVYKSDALRSFVCFGKRPSPETSRAMSPLTTAVAINQASDQAPDQRNAPSLTLRATDRSPRRSYAARTDQVSELDWVYDWLHYMTDRSQCEQRLVPLRDRLADRYSLRHKSSPRSHLASDGLDESHFRQALGLTTRSTIVEALEILWLVLERIINTLTRGKRTATKAC